MSSRSLPSLVLTCLFLSACGGESVRMRPLPVPSDSGERARAMRDGGRLMYTALREGRPESLLADDVTLRALLDAEAASRYTALRIGSGVRLATPLEALAQLSQADYVGVCLQGVRLEPAHDRLGLTEPGWVFDRALVAGIQPSGRRMAAWVEGTFVYTPGGFVALDLTRVEAPRWEHSDLELAPCDMQVGIQGPQDVAVATP